MKVLAVVAVISIIAPFALADENDYQEKQLRLQQEQVAAAQYQNNLLFQQMAYQASKDSNQNCSFQKYIPRTAFTKEALLYMDKGRCAPISSMGPDGFIPIDAVKPCPH